MLITRGRHRVAVAVAVSRLKRERERKEPATLSEASSSRSFALLSGPSYPRLEVPHPALENSFVCKFRRVTEAFPIAKRRKQPANMPYLGLGSGSQARERMGNRPGGVGRELKIKRPRDAAEA